MNKQLILVILFLLTLVVSCNAGPLNWIFTKRIYSKQNQNKNSKKTNSQKNSRNLINHKNSNNQNLLELKKK